MRRALSTVIGLALVGGTTVAAGPAGAARAPLDYVHDREWLYSAKASEVPQSVGVDERGRVYLIANIAGYGEDDSRMRVYSSKGKLLHTWDVPAPIVTSIDVDAAGNVLLTDYLDGEVETWTPKGRHLATFTLTDEDDWSATHVVRAADDTLWLTDVTHDVIHHLSATGDYLGRIGARGSAPGQLDSPHGIDVLPNGNLVVAEDGNARVQVLTPAGDPVVMWGQPGSGPGQFLNGARQVEVRRDGRVYVADSTGRIQAFTAKGALVDGFKPVTADGGLVDDLGGLRFGPDGALYVAGHLGPFENGVVRYVAARGKATVAATQKPLRIAKRTLRVTVQCSKAGRCVGGITVTVRGTPLTKAKTYSIAAGKKARLRLKVTDRGLRQVPRTGTAKAKVRTTGTTATIRVRR
jgi:sugar lactone lactonase YvrE